MVGHKLNEYENYFQPPEVVGRGGETQLQLGENLNYLTKRFRVKTLTLYRYGYFQPST